MTTSATSRPATRRLLVALVAGVFLLGACGSDGDDTADSDVDTGQSSEGSGSGGSDSGGSGGSDAIGALGDSECREFAEAFADFDQFNPTDFAEMSDLADRFSAAADQAPSEIRSDMQTIAAAFVQFADAVADLDIDFNDPASITSLSEADLGRLQDAGASFDNDELAAAGERIEAFLESNCR